MKVIVQYIPLAKIIPAPTSGSVARTHNKKLKALQQAAKDCTNVLLVRKTRNGYILLSGSRHYEYLKKYTKLLHVPCIVDEPTASTRVSGWLDKMRKRKLPYELPFITKEQTNATSWNIIRTLMKQDPRFRRLSRSKQWKVLLIGIRYKQTTIKAMKARITELLS